MLCYAQLLSAHDFHYFSFSSLSKRECEVFVSNLNGFSSNVLLILQIEVLQSFTVLVLAVQLHPLGSSELVELLLLVLHLLVSLPQLQIGPTRGHLIYRLANVVNLALVDTEGENISYIVQKGFCLIPT